MRVKGNWQLCEKQRNLEELQSGLEITPFIFITDAMRAGILEADKNVIM